LKRQKNLFILTIFLGSILILNPVISYAELMFPYDAWQDGADDDQGLFAGGDGSESSPFQIADATDLKNMAQAINEDKEKYGSKHYILTADIEMFQVAADQSNHVAIGSYASSKPFSGTFDGQGHTISGLVINKSSESYQGLFGYVGPGGVVKNVGLIDSFIVGGDFVGSVVGLNEGTVDNCYSTGDVWGKKEIGGIAGRNRTSGIIRNSYNTSQVTGTDSEVGGIVGKNVGTVANSYNTGVVSGSSTVGGIVGENNSACLNSYNIGSVNKRDANGVFGGIVGRNYSTSSISPQCLNCYWLTNDTINKGLSGIGSSAYTSIYENCASFSGAHGILEPVPGHTIIDNKSTLLAALNAWVSSQKDLSDSPPYYYWTTLNSDTGFPIHTEHLLKYSLTYDANGATGGSTPVVEGAYEPGTTITVLGPGDLEKTGYSFIAWNTKADGSGIEYNEGSTFVIGHDNVTLYAIWTKDNAGIALPTIKTLEPEVTPDTVILKGQLADTGGAETSLYFEWGTDEDFSETSTIIDKGLISKITSYTHILQGLKEEQTYYYRAVASNLAGQVEGEIKEFKLTPVYYTVTFQDYNGTVLKTETVKHGGKARAPVDPTRSGYVFSGWDKDFTNVTTDLEVTALYTRQSSPGPNSGSSAGRNRTNSTTKLLENARDQVVGQEVVIEENGEKKVIFRVDPIALNEITEQIVEENVLEISISSTGVNQVDVILTGDIIHRLEQNHVRVSIKTEHVDYNIPVKALDIQQVASQLNRGQASLNEIEVKIQIAKANQATEIIEVAEASGYKVLVSPVELKVVAKNTSHRDQENEINITKFSSYVSILFALPEEINQEQITTGIVYNQDGTFSHIPTALLRKHNKLYAQLSSLTNSVYAVIANPVSVTAVENHWSKESVNELASRLVIKNPDTFAPNEFITRGEFAEYMTKALGIYRTGVATWAKFSDVDLASALADPIAIAVDYKIISGYPDGTFRPERLISREEAMVMYSQAMEIVSWEETANNGIEKYKDLEQVAPWAYKSVKKTVSAGVFNGKTSQTIAPKSLFTYGEAATAIRNLLSKADLIN
jgi:uncharacterized repeat protein (TIGR02543 family)